jgi:hypothetical protein
MSGGIGAEGEHEKPWGAGHAAAAVMVLVVDEIS